MIRFNGRYFALAALLFGTEVAIALFVHDRFVRPVGGDVLVVVLIYCALRSFVQARPWKVALPTLALAFVVETLQYFHFVGRLGLQRCKPIAIALGQSFAWEDLVAYTLGFGLILAGERLFNGGGARESAD